MGEPLPQKYAERIKARIPFGKGGILVDETLLTPRWLEAIHLNIFNEDIDRLNRQHLARLCHKTKKHHVVISSVNVWRNTKDGNVRHIVGGCIEEQDLVDIFGPKLTSVRDSGGVLQYLTLLEGHGAWMLTRNIAIDKCLGNGALIDYITIHKQDKKGVTHLKIRLQSSKK